MVMRIGPMVACGEILNTHKNTVHGWLGLRDREEVVMICLTGNPEPDLVGKHIRFEARETEGSDAAEMMDLSDFATQQVGPTGTMTTARRQNGWRGSSPSRRARPTRWALAG